MNIGMDTIYNFGGKDVVVQPTRNKHLKIINLGHIRLFVSWEGEKGEGFGFRIKAMPIKAKEVEILFDEEGFLQKNFDQAVSLKFNSGFLNGLVFSSEDDCFCLDWNANRESTAHGTHEARVDMEGVTMHLRYEHEEVMVRFRVRVVS